MAEIHDSEHELELFFEAATLAAPVPSEALMARILADAEDERTRIAPAPRKRTGAVLRGLARLGGWPALAGLVTAAAAGVWIGYAAPDNLAALTGAVWPDSSAGYDVVDMIPSWDGLLAEGGA